MKISNWFGCLCGSRPELVTKLDLQEMEKRMAKTMKQVEEQLGTVLDAIGGVATNVSAVSPQLSAVGTQLGKALGEITNEIQALKDAVVNGTVSDEASARLDRVSDSLATLGTAVQGLSKVSESLGTVSKALDDLNPDEPEQPPAQPPS